jgi:hypothetical protein
MKVKEFDYVRLHDGRIGTIVDAEHAPEMYLFEDGAAEVAEIVSEITHDQIAEVIR